MSNKPADVANESLDQIGLSEMAIGDLEEGTAQAQVLLRKYWTCLRALHRAANWDFARTEAPLVLLADASGQTEGVGRLVPIGQFQYEYRLPIDSARIRYIPWQPFISPGAPSGNIIPANSSSPLMTGIGNSSRHGQRISPAKFLVTNDPNYAPPQGSQTSLVQGQSPQDAIVILTNVPNAHVIYTKYVIYPSVWDMLFRQAMVAYLASEVSFSLWVKKGKPEFGIKVRDEQIGVLKSKVMEARIADGNEGASSSDIAVDWMRTRRSGGWGSRGGSGGGWDDDDGAGGYGGGWDGIALASGAVF